MAPHSTFSRKKWNGVPVLAAKNSTPLPKMERLFILAKANQKKYLVSSIPTDPLFFKKGKKKGVVFRWLVAATPFFLQRQFRLYLLRKDGRGLVIVRRPTDLQLRETVRIPETSLVGLIDRKEHPMEKGASLAAYFLQ